MKLTLRTAPFFLLLFSISTISCKEHTQTIPLTIQTQQKEITISAETAITPKEQQKGFMHRTEIPDGTGMLFIYQHDTHLRFWMKNTPHALSIAFIDSRGKIREIRDMQPFSLETVTSTNSVRYALEVPQGYFTRAGIKAGDSCTNETLTIIQTLLQ